MDTTASEPGQAFLARTRAFLRAHWRAGEVGLTSTAAVRHWEQSLLAEGWTVPGWPPEYGGPGWSLAQRYEWNRETRAAGAPAFNPAGTQFVGPLLMRLPDVPVQELDAIRTGDQRWSHGLTGAGSLHIERDGDNVRLNGSAPWVEGVPDPDRLLLLAQELDGGESLVVAGAGLAGVALEPIAGMDGGVVRVTCRDCPAKVLAWPGPAREVLSDLLCVAPPEYFPAGDLSAHLERLRVLAYRLEDGEGGVLGDDESIAADLASAGVALAALLALEARAHDAIERGAEVQSLISMLFVKSAELAGTLGWLQHTVAGHLGLPPVPREGDNQPGVVPDYALPVIQGMLRGRPWTDTAARLAHDKLVETFEDSVGIRRTATADEQGGCRSMRRKEN